MRKLFSMFVHGAPGLGLLLIRTALGGALLGHAIGVAIDGSAVTVAVVNALSALVGLLMILGFWTPVAGVLGVMYAAWGAFMAPSDLAWYALLGMLAAGLTLLGPGAWSIDARRFGLRRLEIPNRREDGERPPPPLSRP